MNTITKTMFFGMGVGATSPLLALVVGGRIISLIGIAFSYCFINLILRNNKIQFRIAPGLSQLFMGWMSISIISSLFGFIYFWGIDSRYSMESVRFIPLILSYLSFFILLISDSNSYSKCHLILQGIKYGIILNIIWSIIDASMYYTIRQSLTNNVFKSYIVAANMNYGIASIIDGVSIRSVGLNNDPATIGFFSIAAAAYAFIMNKKWILVLCLLSAFSCVSFVGVIGILIVICYSIFSGIKYKLRNRVFFIEIFISFLSICFIGVWITNTNNSLVSQLRTAIELRAESKTDGDHSLRTRELFISKFPAALKTLPISLCIGTGYNTGVYAYYQEGVSYNHENKPTAMENTYVDIFFALGLPGLLLFIIFYYMLASTSQLLFKRNRNEICAIIYSISAASLIAFFAYHYTLYSVIMLTSIAGIIVIISLRKNSIYEHVD